MREILLEEINAHYDGGHFEPITGIIWHGDSPYQLFSFEPDVEIGKDTYRCVYIKKLNYDQDDISCVDTSEDIYFDYWKIN